MYSATTAREGSGTSVPILNRLLERRLLCRSAFFFVVRRRCRTHLDNRLDVGVGNADIATDGRFPDPAGNYVIFIIKQNLIKKLNARRPGISA